MHLPKTFLIGVAALAASASLRAEGPLTKWSALSGVKASAAPSWPKLKQYLRLIAANQYPGSLATETFKVGRVLELNGANIQLVYWVNRNKLLSIDHPIDLNPEFIPYQMSKRCLQIDSSTLKPGEDPNGSTYLSTWANTQEMLRECNSNGVEYVIAQKK